MSEPVQYPCPSCDEYTDAYTSESGKGKVTYKFHCAFCDVGWEEAEETIDFDAYKADHKHCPYCGSDRLVSRAPSFEDGGVEVVVTCFGCEKRWNAVYTLTSVEDIDD